MAQNDTIISTLNNLIQTCKDGENGYRDAADNVMASTLKSLFQDHAQQRARFAGELQSAVRQLGGDPETSGSTAAALHRRWIDVKAAVTSRDDAAILAECTRGDDIAVSAYEDALKETLSGDVKTIVQHQMSHIKAARDHMNVMEQSRSA